MTSKRLVAQADIALLVVSADAGFEAGMAPDDGQTREHALLARTLGVSQARSDASQCGLGRSR